MLLLCLGYIEMPKALKSLYKSNHSKKRQRESLPELLDEDDIEIARLEKLLGIDTGCSRSYLR